MVFAAIAACRRFSREAFFDETGNPESQGPSWCLGQHMRTRLQKRYRFVWYLGNKPFYGKRLADKIALELGQYFVEQGWIPPEALKKPLF